MDQNPVPMARVWVDEIRWAKEADIHRLKYRWFPAHSFTLCSIYAAGSAVRGYAFTAQPVLWLYHGLTTTGENFIVSRDRRMPTTTFCIYNPSMGAVLWLKTRSTSVFNRFWLDLIRLCIGKIVSKINFVTPRKWRLKIEKLFIRYKPPEMVVISRFIYELLISFQLKFYKFIFL